MPKRTQIVCIHEGEQGKCIDSVFANAFIKAYNPERIRPLGTVDFRPGRGKTELRKDLFPKELKACKSRGGDTTLIVLSDLDDDCADGDELKQKFWRTIHEIDTSVTREDFEKVVFIFPKDRIENWIEFLSTGTTNEQVEGARVEFSEAKDAGRKLAEKCRTGNMGARLPQSLAWSCSNWHGLIERMRH